jgi:adenylate kinase
VTDPIVAWYAERDILMSVDAMRPPEQVGREILAALEVMRPLVDHVPEEARQAVDLTSLGVAFGATPQPPTHRAKRGLSAMPVSYQGECK